MRSIYRFRLWRVDADRVRIEGAITALCGQGIAVGEIAQRAPQPRHASAQACREIDDVLQRLTALEQRCRKESLSVFVPMGEEMSYRYQAMLIQDLVHALRSDRDRLPAAGSARIFHEWRTGRTRGANSVGGLADRGAASTPSALCTADGAQAGAWAPSPARDAGRPGVNARARRWMGDHGLSAPAAARTTCVIGCADASRTCTRMGQRLHDDVGIGL